MAAASRTTPVPRPTASRMSTTTTTTADEEEAARVGRTVAVVFGSIFLGFVAFAGGLFTNAVVRSNRAPVRVRSSRVLELD